MRDPDFTARVIPQESARSAWRIAHWRTEPGPGLAEWLLHCPGLHAFWDYWFVSLCHLRPAPGMPDENNPDGHSHELIVAAIAPGSAPDPERPRDTFRLMQPVDVVQRFSVESDESAVRVVEELVRMNVKRQLNPDSDFRELWPAAVQRAIAHVKAAL